MKTILYRLFGFGKIPEDLRNQLETEGLLMLDEGIRSSITYRNFSAPGKRCHWKRKWFTGSIALTKTRLTALWRSKPIINIPLTDERIGKLRFEQEKNGALLIVHDAALFHQDWSGTIEYRFRVEQAQTFLDMLRQRIRK